jgi:hypothetical protein
MINSADVQRLVLHIGAPKTGTSALQVAFVRNRSALRSAGVRYPESSSDSAASAGKITSGNGLAIAAFLNPNLPFAPSYKCTDPLGRIFDSFRYGPEKIVLYSCEHMSFFEDRRLVSLTEFASKHSVVIQVIYFVRNIVDHAYSTYNQLIKRHRSTITFGEFVTTKYCPPFSRTVRRARAILGNDNLSLLSYDDTHRTLLGSTLAAMGVEGANIAEACERVNRSLTEVEIELMRRVNKRFDSERRCRRISDALIYRQPDIIPAETIGNDIICLMSDRFKSEVTLLNELARRELLSMQSPNRV